MKIATGLATLAVAIASTMSIGQVRAVEEVETFSSNPSARCQPATPASEAQFRKRPLAMVNEGATTATINCAFEMEVGESLGQAVELWASNSTATAKAVTCTAVSGWETRTNEYLPQTVTVPANSQAATPFFWEDIDFAGGTGGLISVSCAMPTGTALNDTYVSFLIDDGPATP